VRNITDVDDKIIAAATEQGMPISGITEKYARIYNEDLAALNCLPPTHQPRATDHISHMIGMIGTLLDKGFAYEADGHVFFDVSTYDDYGKLSGNRLENLRSGDRIGEGEAARKRNEADFVLWKPELGGVGWDAPFGRGRPGWHIECSAMVRATLGEVIDIHCGGVDLKFPHHENEIAQSCCANNRTTFARFWVHNEFLNMDSGKMSKSLGNVIPIRDLLGDWDGEVIRLALLKAHYRSELIWTEDLLRESKAQLDGWYRVIEKAVSLGMDRDMRDARPDEKFISTIENDINTMEFLSGLECLKTRFFGEVEKKERLGEHTPGHEIFISILNPFVFMAGFLGFLRSDPQEWFKGGRDTDRFDRRVRDYDNARAQAVAAKKSGNEAKTGELFRRSDTIREELQSEGIIIETGPDGSSWRQT
ncbi:MAG: cysteine--tRNA ligase, partial [Hyphomonadaceae bacterium]|nr:cysteine--tRNA ligase [Hyphomonadaceae bacterium]